MKKIVLICVSFILLAHYAFTKNMPGVQGNHTIQSFNKAKKYLHNSVYSDHMRTFYCNCKYTRNKKVNWKSCGYKYRKNKKRAGRLEWEHVVPAQAFGQSFREWRNGDSRCVNRKGKLFKGRRCAEKINITYRLMQADMYNLYPAIGEINGDRSNYSMAMLPGEKRKYGKCDCEIAGRKIEPRPAVRGDIARTYMYMDNAYPGRGIISRKNRKMFEAWNRIDPVDAWECKRARRIAKIQKNKNIIVVNACRARGL